MTPAGNGVGCSLHRICFRPIKYSLFPPLATLAGYLPHEVEVTIHDEHVERLGLAALGRPDLVVIQVYITSARRSYEIADHFRGLGVYVVLGGLHVTALPDEAAAHADTIFRGPGEDTWSEFLADLRARTPKRRYVSRSRTLAGLPPVRRDLIKRHRYLVPNSIVVSRGCPYHCDFCYKDGFFAGGKSFYTQAVDDALAEIDRLPGRHLYFLDDHLLGNRRFAEALFDGMAGTGRLWQAAATVDAVLAPGLLEKAVTAGLRSLFVGFETVNSANLAAQRKRQNVGRDYAAVLGRLHDARAYRDFHRWRAIWRGASTKDGVRDRLRHLAYAGGWKRFEALWDLAIRTGRVLHALPLLEATLSGTCGTTA